MAKEYDKNKYEKNMTKKWQWRSWRNSNKKTKGKLRDLEISSYDSI